MAGISRREAGKILVAGTAGALLANQSIFAGPKVNSVVRGVTIGAQSYSFRFHSIFPLLYLYPVL